MRTKLKPLIFVAVALIAFSAPTFLPVAACAAQAVEAAPQSDWQAEFDDICSKTQDAMAMGVDELKAVLDRCDKLKVKIEALEGTQRKVYLRRLEMCRGVFAFALESKEKK